MDIKEFKSDKRYKVVCYMRVEAENQEPMALAQAIREAEQAELMQPENKYVVELIDEAE
jgi:hypothetical protein